MSVAAYRPERDDIWFEVKQDPERFFAVLRARHLIDDEAYATEMKALQAKPVITGVRDLIVAWPTVWEEADEDRITFLNLLADRGIISHETVLAWQAETEVGPTPVGPLAEEVKAAVYAVATSAATRHIQAWLTGLWEWIKEHLGPLIDMVVGAVKSVVLTAWEYVKSFGQDLVVKIYKSFTQMVDGFAPITPENVTPLIAKLYLAAYGFGIGAHLTALGVEAVHPFKNLGMSQVAAMIGDFSGFSRLAGATVGVLESKVVGTATTYALMSKFRPVVPDTGTLQTMAVKGDIDLAKFRRLMGYYGYSDEYLDDIVRTMYREPMYRELLIMAESDVATDAWMIDKLRRAGYDSADAAVMHKALLKRIALTQRNSYYSEAFKLYKEGYINQDLFARVLDELEMRPEAKQFAVKAANLAYLYDATSDQVKYWCDSYQKDLLTDDQLRLHLSLLGIVPERVWLLAQIQRVKKYKKPSQPTASGLEKVTAQVQDKYSQAYIQLYRKGLIDTDMLLGDLVAIGIVPDLAEATVFLEAARAA